MRNTHISLILALIFSSKAYTLSQTPPVVYTQKSYGSAGLENSQTFAMSPVDCAHQCSKNIRCRRFSYNADGNNCSMYNNTQMVAQNAMATYGRLCPKGLGYEEDVVDLKYRCTKTTYPQMNYTDAVKTCTSEGAHLFTLENLSDAKYIAGKPVLYVWVDGGQNMRTWYGDTLPWMSWMVSGYPLPTQCPLLNTLSLGMHTVPCKTHSVATPICQIDV